MAGTLYRLFDADENLLYVGASMSAAQRLSQHESDKGWWPEVDHATFQHFDTREEAFAAENEVLADTPGRHNKAGTRRFLTEDEKRERREERERQTKEFRERQERQYSPENVYCGNCGKRAVYLPKGALIWETPCPTCECQTLELREAAA